MHSGISACTSRNESKLYLWRKLGSCVKKWSSGTSSLRSNSTNHAQLGSEQKLNRIKSKLAFAKFNYIYQELSEFKQKGTQEVYFQIFVCLNGCQKNKETFLVIQDGVPGRWCGWQDGRVFRGLWWQRGGPSQGPPGGTCPVPSPDPATRARSRSRSRPCRRRQSLGSRNYEI